MPQRLDYGNMMHRAMRRLIAEVLTQVGEQGLPGDHHFFITFDTTHPGVQMSEWLHERYPDEMTIVLQHWFDGLEVSDQAFAVTLNFGDQPERLTIPLTAIRTFVDPSVEFGLRFESHDSSSEDEEPEEETEAEAEEEPERQPGDAEVVRLDSFRKT